MSNLKQLLKSAKVAIAKNDPQSTLEYVDDILEEEKDNYYAYVFRGKAYQLLNDYDKSKKAFEKATSLKPELVLGWKGYLQSAMASADHKLIFSILATIVELQIEEGSSYAESLKDLRNYLSKQDYKNDLELYETYLRNIIPGSRLGDLVGTNLGRPEDNLKKLIDYKKKQEQEVVKTTVSKAKMKLPRVLNQESKDRLNAIKWSIYEKSDLTQLYESFLNCCSDDALRRKYEEELLSHKHDLLHCSPDKAQSFESLKEMVEGMVLIKAQSCLAWSLYFDWSDVKEFSDLELDQLVEFLRYNQHKGLGMLLYAFLMSDISPFDRSVVAQKVTSFIEPEEEKRSGRRRNKRGRKERLKKNKNKESGEEPPAKQEASEQESPNQDDEEDELLEKVGSDDDQQIEQQYLSPEEVLTMMLTGFKKCSDSVLANRIVCTYLVHLREYSHAAEKCRGAITLLADIQRTLSIDLANTREDLLCSLAIIYTYHEAPKNFPRALQLYDRILEKNEKNYRAKIGKGLILIEKRQLDDAKVLLDEVLSAQPDNFEALRERSWCQIQLGDFAEGRAGLIHALSLVKGVDLNSADNRAVIRWRIAESYILQDAEDVDGIKEAYNQLIQSLKDSKNYAPSYTSLGILYQEHYDDKVRAQKCFYKAFELDASEVTSAKYLVEDFTEKNEWEIAEILCQRVVANEKSRRKLFSHTYKDQDKSWPYRVLGCSALNKQDDAKAVEWFQSALRMKAMDTECWIGLGEAYYNCGRFDAAGRVFQHVLTLDENSWVAKFMLGSVTCELGEYAEGLACLEEALAMKPKEECILGSLYEGYLNYTNKLLMTGFIGRATECNLKAIEYIRQALEVNPRSQNLWKVAGDCLRFFIAVQGTVEQFPCEEVAAFLNNVDLQNDEDKFPQDVTLDKAVELFKEKEYLESISLFIILTCQASITVLPSKCSKYLRSITSYNLGLSLLESYNICDIEKHREYSVKNLKKAIQLESNNVSYWVALGNAYSSFNPQISQHCYIKASTLDSRDGGIWSNLAALYLRYGDAELAQEAFMRSQSVSPQQSQPWLGHALTAQANGNDEVASRLFTHAYVLSNGRSPLANLLYGLSILDGRVKTGGSDERDLEAAQEFSIANFSMQKFLQYQPHNELGLKVALTISERCHDYDGAISLGIKLCDTLEKKYEKTESEAVLIEFAKSKTQLARLFLGQGDYEQAVTNAQFTLDVLDADEESQNEEITTAVLSSKLVIGLSFFFDDQFDEALDEFKHILSTHSDSSRLITFIAQVLHAYGTPDTKQAAVDQLFAYIEEYGSSLLVVLTLGAISIVDDLADYLVPIKEELEGLSLAEVINDSRRAVPQLLEEIDRRIGDAADTKVWQRSAMFFPHDESVWKRLNSRMALTVSSLSEAKQNAAGLSELYVANGRLREIQRGILLCPDNQTGVHALNGCL